MSDEVQLSRQEREGIWEEHKGWVVDVGAQIAAETGLKFPDGVLVVPPAEDGVSHVGSGNGAEHTYLPSKNKHLLAFAGSRFLPHGGDKAWHEGTHLFVSAYNTNDKQIRRLVDDVPGSKEQLVDRVTREVARVVMEEMVAAHLEVVKSERLVDIEVMGMVDAAYADWDRVNEIVNNCRDGDFVGVDQRVYRDLLKDLREPATMVGYFFGDVLSRSGAELDLKSLLLLDPVDVFALTWDYVAEGRIGRIGFEHDFAGDICQLPSYVENRGATKRSQVD